MELVCYIPMRELRHHSDASGVLLGSYDSKCLRSKPNDSCYECLVRKIWTRWLVYSATLR